MSPLARLKFFGLTVFSAFGIFGGILAGVLGHPVLAAMLIVGTGLIAAGALIFDGWLQD